MAWAELAAITNNVNAPNLVSEVQDEICLNETYEKKLGPAPSFSAADAPPRKLAGFNYYSLYPSVSE